MKHAAIHRLPSYAPHRKRNDGGGEALLLDVPLDAERNVRLFTSGDNVRVELFAPVAGQVITALDLGLPDVEKVRAATRALVALRDRLAAPPPPPPPAEVVPPLPDMGDVPPYGVVLREKDSEESDAFKVYLPRAGVWAINANFKQLVKLAPTEDLKSWGFRTTRDRNTATGWSDWFVEHPEGVRALMERLGARLAISRKAWNAYRAAAASGSLPALSPSQAPAPLPSLDPGALGLPPPPYGVRFAMPGSGERFLLAWNHGRGWEIQTTEPIYELFRVVKSKENLRSWGFHTGPANPQRTAWLPWATWNTSGVLEVMKHLKQQGAITPDAWGEYLRQSGGATTDAGLSQRKPRIVRAGKNFEVVATQLQTGELEGPLLSLGFETAHGSWFARSLAPVYALMQSNLRDVFDVEGDVSAEVQRFAQSIAESTIATGEACTRLIAPPGKAYLPYQCAGIAYAMSRENTLIGDEPGLGKTIQLLGYVNNRPDVQNVLVVAPASLLSNWRREAERWLTRPFMLYVCEDTQAPVPPQANFVIVNYEKLIDTTLSYVDYGPVEQVHAPMPLGQDTWGVMNRVSGRRVGTRTYRSFDAAQKKAEEFSRYGEPQPDGTLWGTTVTLGYWWEERGRRGRREKPAYWIVDPSWRPAKQARLPTGGGRGDVPVGKPEKRTRPSIIHRDLMARSWDLLGIDEVHKLKTSGMTPQKSSVACFGEYDRNGVRVKEGLSQRARGRIYLTGTPMPNRTIEMFSILRDLDPANFGHFFQFAQRYAGAKKISIGRGEERWDFSGNTNSGELYDRLRGTIMVRRRKQDVLKELPPKMRQIVLFPASIAAEAGIDLDTADLDALEARVREAVVTGRLDARTRHSYAQAAADLELLSEEDEGERIPFNKISRMRRDLAVAKVPYVIEHVEDLFDAGIEAVVVMAHHHEVQNKLLAAFNKAFGEGSAVLHTGGMAPTAKDEAVVAFQGVEEGGRYTPPRKGCRIFIGSILASGVGITLTRAHTLLFAELDWVPGNVTQAEDRVHRIGQTTPVLIQHLVVAESLDARLVEAIIEKQAAIDGVMDEARAAESFDLAAYDAAIQAAATQAAHVPIEVPEPIEPGEALPRPPRPGRKEMTLEEWAIQTILRYHRDGLSAFPLNTYDRSIVAHVVAHHAKGLSTAKERAAVAVAYKIAGSALRHRATVEESPPRGPATTHELWAATAIQRLAAMDEDYAAEKNLVGFSASHSGLGHELEAKILAGAMNDMDWRAAVAIAMKYQRTQTGRAPAYAPLQPGVDYSGIIGGPEMPSPGPKANRRPPVRRAWKPRGR